MNYEIINKERAYNGYFKIDRYKIRHDTFTPGESIQKILEVFERGDSCAILIFEKDTNSLLFINQFRLPVAIKESGWIVDLVAGKIDEGEEPLPCILREVAEEIGYEIKSAQLISSFYVSPGGSSEKIFLFYAETNSGDKVNEGGGKKGEGEDIQLVRIPVKEISDQLNQFIDAKTIIAIQWYLMNKMKKT
jgi:ADP-ribose pyrophosphatase